MNVGILGCGAIGGGVLELLDKSSFATVKKVFDLPTKKEFLGERFAQTADEICLNPEVDTVFEAMGGDKFPYECIKKALLNGKNVITSNKEVVSLHIDEFSELAEKNGVNFMFEASVGGGIPLICTLIDLVKTDKINRIYGIINGTTNYILTKIDRDNVSFEEALKDAQKLGFAEADPTADLEGYDMMRKISILSDIAYGGKMEYSSVYNYGISKVTKEILSKIDSLGYKLKFVAESRIVKNGVAVSVEPVLVTLDNGLSGINYENNAVFFECENNDTLGFYGKGAGRYPTASAMVCDAMRIVGGGQKYYFKNQNSYKVCNFKQTSKYVCFDGESVTIVDGLDDAKKHDFVARIF